MLGIDTLRNFQEEEDLVNAHRRQVEEIMNIAREVCDNHSVIEGF